MGWEEFSFLFFRVPGGNFGGWGRLIGRGVFMMKSIDDCQFENYRLMT